MNDCRNGCPREIVQQDLSSLGIIGDEEMIVRGAFDPRHANASTGNIRNAIVPKKALMNGDLSVWRTEPYGIATDELVAKLDNLSDNKLYALCGLPAGTIRSINCNDKRALSVVDECECDGDGNRHPAHAHIAFCKSLLAQGITVEHMQFEQARMDLYAQFKNSLVWKRNAA